MTILGVHLILLPNYSSLEDTLFLLPISNVLGGHQRPKLLFETLSVLEQPRCAIEYVPRPPLADSDHEIVLVKGGRVKLI